MTLVGAFFFDLGSLQGQGANTATTMDSLCPVFQAFWFPLSKKYFLLSSIFAGSAQLREISGKTVELQSSGVFTNLSWMLFRCVYKAGASSQMSMHGKVSSQCWNRLNPQIIFGTDLTLIWYRLVTDLIWHIYHTFGTDQA